MTPVVGLRYDHAMATQILETPDPLDELWAVFEHAAQFDDGAAAAGHLAAGRAIFYREAGTPAGTVIKEYPNGHRELVRFDGRDEVVVRSLA